MNKKEKKLMFLIGKIVSEIIINLKTKIKSGITGIYLDEEAKRFMKKKNVFSSSLSYRGFSKHICVSINNILTHGIPNKNKLKAGDLVSLDVACHLKYKNKNYHADAAITTIVEKENIKNVEDLKRKEYLINSTKEILESVINFIKPEKTKVSEIGEFIENYAKKKNLFSIKEYGGHGIGYNLHEEPFIPNYKFTKKDRILKEGMFICIEPLIQEKDDLIKTSRDGWSVFSTNGNLNAHFEHTIYISKKKALILTDN